MFVSGVAQTLMEPLSHRDHHLPDPRDATLEERVIFYVLALIASALCGGTGGAICGRVALAMARRGVNGKLLAVGVAVVCAALGVLMATPDVVTSRTIAVLASIGSLGVLIGVALARRALSQAAVVASGTRP